MILEVCSWILPVGESVDYRWMMHLIIKNAAEKKHENNDTCMITRK